MKSNLKHLLSRAMLMLVAVAGGGIFSSCDKSIADNPAVPTTVTVNTFMADGTTPLPVTTFKLVSVGTNNTYDLSAAIPEGGASTFSTEFLVNDHISDWYFDAFANGTDGKSYTANLYYHPMRGQAQTINVKLKETATPADDSDDSDDALNVIDLSTVTEDITIEDGLTVTGTLAKNVKISIAKGATVTLDGVDINGVNDENCMWAGITCLGDATIILKDGSTNTVKGFYENYPGIYVPGDAEPANNKTLTIKGTGSLEASSNGYGPGIGGGYGIACGNIIIEGGTITATGGDNAAGIGSGDNRSCGTITISGGKVTATGGAGGAGIGSGADGSCGNIVIEGGTITATGGDNAAGIGSGQGDDNLTTLTTGKCGDILISGGTVKATGGENGAGIGSSYYGSCGNISISGGTVEATGGENGAGIGSGFYGSCGNITITTGVTQVTATKGDYAQSIGAGDGGSCTSVTIDPSLNQAISTKVNTDDTLTLTPAQ